MSAVKQIEAPRGTPPRDALLDEEAFIESQVTESPARTRAKLRPLLALAPYVARYRGRALLAFVSLTIAAITTLVVPIAVRRMIDFGFSPEGIALINSYFSVMIAVVAVLAAASASRYYLVMTIGERIVADLRRDVFAHLVSLSPAFFDSARSGELVSRLTADTTQIKSAVGASVSIALRNMMLFIVFSSVVAILWVGSHDVLTGQITPGRLGQFVLYAAFAATGLGQLSEVWGEVSAASGAAERLFEILRVKSQITAPPQPAALPQPARGDVGFENVSFAYPTRPDVLAIDNVSLAVKAGEKVAIVGPSGAGKSTLFHLLLRFYDPARGTISLDGVPVKSADPVDVRARIALVPQDSVVFAASARENIRFGRPDASDAEVERAADLAHATEFLRRLPGGFEAQLGERGVTLSGGQRQRIAIARAILRDAPLLLLDEATSALDAESESLVQTAP